MTKSTDRRQAPAFVDSVVLIGALLKRDKHHAHGLAILLAADEGRIPPLILTDFILAETISFLTRKGGSAIGRDALRRIEGGQGFRIERISDAVYHEGKNDVYQRIDDLSFVDALTVAFMRHKRLRWIYSFNEGFDRVPGIERVAATP